MKNFPLFLSTLFLAILILFGNPGVSAAYADEVVPESAASLSPEIAPIVQQIRNAMWGKNRALYMEQTMKMSSSLFGEKIMKSRGWTKLPNKSRYEVIEPADMASTFISNGKDTIYINNKGEVYRPNNQQRAQSSYQQDFTQFFEEFDMAQKPGGGDGFVTLQGTPRKGSMFEKSFKELEFVIDSARHLVTQQTLIPKDAPFVTVANFTYGAGGFPKLVEFTMKPRSAQTSKSDDPMAGFMAEMMKKTETHIQITTTKLERYPDLPDSTFELGK